MAVHMPVEGVSMVLGDEQLIFLEALACTLTNAGHDVSATCSSYGALLTAVRRETPSLCITDSRYSDAEIGEVLEALATAAPRCRLIILTGGGSPDMVRAALDGGAHGIVQKDRGLGVLLDVVRRVGRGETVIEASFAPPPRKSESAHARRLAQCLTQREYECLSLLVSGMDTAAMSGHLGISRTTVRTHVQSLLCKLGVHSRLEAAAVATRYGLTDNPVWDPLYSTAAS